jgi:hypothetical protein
VKVPVLGKSQAATLVLGLLGGLAGGSLRSGLEKRAEAAPPPGPQKQVSAEQFVLVDANGKTLAQLAKSGEGSPCLFVFDKEGKIRLEAGVYGDGQPFFGLFDAKYNALGLFRVAGSQGSPVLVLKAGGRDRMIVGLGMNDPAQEPFVEYYDVKGEKHELIEKK